MNRKKMHRNSFKKWKSVGSVSQPCHWLAFRNIEALFAYWRKRERLPFILAFIYILSLFYL